MHDGLMLTEEYGKDDKDKTAYKPLETTEDLIREFYNGCRGSRRR